jgi:hypothetical protein
MYLKQRARRAILAAVTLAALGVSANGVADVAAAYSGVPPTGPVLTASPPGSAANDAVSEPGGGAAVTTPTAPRSPAATAGNAKVGLTWLAPLGNGGATVNRYRVQRSTSASGPWTGIGRTTARKFTATGLVNGTRYYFRVGAHNVAGWGPFSPVVSAAPRTVPSAPQSPAATPGNTTISLAWVAPSNNGGSPLTKYAVQWATKAAGPWTTSAFPTGTTYTEHFLANGTTLYFRIRAHNAAGWGAPSTVVSATPATVPSAPATCSASQVGGSGSHALGVQWSAPADDGGAPIQVYLIHVDQNGTQVLGDSIAAPATSTFETLDFGLSYDVSVAAYNGVGSGVGGWCHVSSLNMNP